MDALKLHLFLNYYPAILTAAGTAFLTIGIWLKSGRATRTGLWIMIAAAIVAMPVFVSGEISGGASFALTGLLSDALRSHQEAARPAFLVMAAAGLASLIGLILLKIKTDYARIGVILALILGLTASVLIIRTTYIGRQVKWAGKPAANEGM
ncbi:MAG TPA: hypothetical protein DEA22_12510 [Blastocatellia bacterium]|nr:hypothetical protein [Blastocatellia bacterium]